LFLIAGYCVELLSDSLNQKESLMNLPVSINLSKKHRKAKSKIFPLLITSTKDAYNTKLKFADMAFVWAGSQQLKVKQN
jgi:hypothetical protein